MGYARILDMKGYDGIWWDMLGYVGICWDMLGYVGYAGMCGDIVV